MMTAGTRSATPRRASLDIHVYVSLYPSAYKPYYDAQFAEILDQGHDLHIFAHDRISRHHSDLVEAYGLGDRTRYLLADGARPALRLGPVAALKALANPLSGARRVRRSTSRAGGAKAAVKHGIRALVLPRTAPDLCLVHAHETMLLVPWLRDIYPGVPVALYYHGGRPPEAGRLDERKVRRAFEGASTVFTNTMAAREAAIVAGSPPDRTRVVPVGFRLSRFTGFDAREYRPGGRLRLIIVGRLSEGKGVDVAIRALGRLRDLGRGDIVCEIAGGGPERGRLEALAERMGVAASTRFLGSIRHERVLDRLAEADLLLLPSIPTETTSETQGTVLQEALLQGALVAGSRIGGVPESVPPFLHPLLVEPADPVALSDVIMRVAAMDAVELRALAGRGREWVSEHYDNAVIVPRLLREALGGGSG
jgi:colanic acid/amylovoran biosynthesis glycosyltransferase